MPWVIACFDLLATPILDHCLAVRKLALQTGILEEETDDEPIVTQAANASNTSSRRQKESSLSADTMAPSAEEQRQGKARLNGTLTLPSFIPN